MFYVVLVSTVLSCCVCEFNVQGSVHRKYIPFDIFPTRYNIT